MPTYDYKCKDCGHAFEEFQSISAEPLTDCPVCNGTVQRVISGGTGLIFKGSGFYITDYPNKNEDKNGSAKNGTSDSKKSSETKSESKSDKKEKTEKKSTSDNSSKESS